MRKLICTSAALLLLSVFSMAQTSYVLEPGPVDYNNIDDNYTTPVIDQYDQLLDDCTSISYYVDYSFSDEWDVGNPKMESSTACGGCAGDPNSPASSGCDNCWDFMWIEFLLDGNVEYEKLIGVPGCIDQTGTEEYGPICVDDASEASIRITNSNWAQHETNTFENVTIFCWEGLPSITTNNPICGISEFDLLGSAADESIIDSWNWTTNGSGNIDDSNAQNTFASNMSDGDEFTLTVTDENSCTATEEVVVALTSVTATLTGGGEVCEDGCLTDGDVIELEMSGGSAPYTVNFFYNGFEVPFPFPIDIDLTYIQICHSSSIGIPEFQDGNPVIITLPDNFLISWPIDIAISEVIDDDGCIASINGGSVELELVPRPDIEEPDVQPMCLDAGTMIDLTVYDTEILNGGPGDVIWLESMDVEDDISNPDNYDILDGDKVFAVVYDDPCYSDIIPVCLEVRIRPEIQVTGEVINCGTEYTFQDFDELVTIINADSPAYYLDDTFTNGPYQPGDVVDIFGLFQIYVYDESAPGCFAVGPIEVSLLPIPEITPIGTLSACGSIELPEPQIFDFDDYNYNTQEDGFGDPYYEGDILPASSMIDILYLIATTDEGCRDTVHVNLEYLSGVRYMADVPIYNCDTLFLPPITPPSSTVGYYTNGEGTGTPYLPGDTISFALANMTTNVLDTLYLLDPTQSGACAEADTIVFEILETPEFTNPGDQDFCGSGLLPEIQVGSTLEYSADRNFSTLLDPNIPVTTTTKIYVRDSVYFSNGISACGLLDSFQMNVIEEPFAGKDTTITICEGYDLSFNLNELLGFPDPNGTFGNSGIPDLDLTDPNNVDFSPIGIGNYEITYSIVLANCPPDIGVIFFEIVNQPQGSVMDTTVTYCTLDNPYNLEALLEFPDVGGRWFARGPMGTELAISDPTNFLLSTVPNAELTPGIYEILYIIDPESENPFCKGFGGLIKFEEGDGLSAGQDVSTTVCKGTIVDLSTLLDNADPGGVYESELILMGNMWDTNITVIGGGPDYEIQYIHSSIACESDTAFLTITLSDELSAGTLIADNVTCEGESIFLNDFLDGETSGGSFYITGDLNNPIPPAWIADQLTEFTYIIEGASGCEPDTTEFFISVLDNITASASYSVNSICDNDYDCALLTIKSSVDGTADIVLNAEPGASPLAFITVDIINGCGQVYLCADDNTSNIIIEDTLQVGPLINEIVVATITDAIGRCNDLDLNQADAFNVYASTEEVYNEIVCTGDPVTINGEDFFTSELLELQTVNGCDSIINLTIDNYPEDTEDLVVRRCEGQDYELLGTTFIRDTLVTLTFPDASFFGCDSTVNLDLVFQDIATGPYMETLCPGGSIMVDGVLFDETNMQAEVPFPGGSVFNCDSSTLVQIDFHPVASDTYEIPFCEGDDDIVIGGDIYNESNLMGTSIIPNASPEGCDSVITVLLTLSPSSEEDDIRTFCGDQDIVVNGMTFNMDNPTGVAPGTNQFGCDSIINVDFTFDLGSEEDYELQLCEDMDVEVNGLIFNMANPSGPALGTNQFGCDSLVNVNLIFGSGTFTISSTICPGANTGMLTIEDIQGFSFPLELSIAEIGLTETITSLPYDIELMIGSYTVSLSDGTCSEVKEVNIISSGASNLSLGSSMLGENTFQLNFDTDLEPATLSWSPSDILDCFDCEMPTAIISENSVVTLELITAEGCTYTEEIFLEYTGPGTTEPDSTLIIYQTNIIQTNLEGNNNFYIQSNYDAVINSLAIYDRWGNQVFINEDFSTNDSSQGWDGRYNNKLVVQGVYVYFINYTDQFGSEQIDAGQLTVLR